MAQSVEKCAMRVAMWEDMSSENCESGCKTKEQFEPSLETNHNMNAKDFPVSLAESMANLHCNSKFHMLAKRQTQS